MIRDPMPSRAVAGPTAGPTAGPDLPVRCPAWFGAVLLCVLLAATGLSRGAVDLADRVNVELGDGRTARGGGAATCRVDVAAAAAGAMAPAAVAAPPRVTPRQRSIADGGLPPPRAPCG